MSNVISGRNITRKEALVVVEVERKKLSPLTLSARKSDCGGVGCCVVSTVLYSTESIH